MPVLVTDAIIRIRTADGTHTTGLHEVLARAHDGALIDLPGMRADQRAPVVTLLAILSHLLRRYSSTPLVTADDWRAALDAQLGTATTLVGGLDDAPQFLQPLLIGLGPVEPFTITEADHLMPATRHALKAADEATPEAALFALMASTWRQFGGPGHPAGARSRLLTVLVGDGVTIASEMLALAHAYDTMAASLVGTQTSPTRLLDHMLWAQPWRDGQVLPTIPFPFVDCRRVRLVSSGDGLVSAVTATGSTRRVADGHVEDPHVPVQVKDGGPYKLVMGRIWSHIVQHRALIGSSEVNRPRILDFAPPYSSVRISGIHMDQGVTGGYWEAAYRIGRGKPMKLGGRTANRLSDLSRRALDVVSEATRLLCGPMLTLHGGKQNAKSYLNRTQERARNLLGHQSLQVVLDLYADPPNTEAEQKQFNAMATAALGTVWREACTTVANPLLVARASLRLSDQMQAKFGEPLMTNGATSTLGKRVHAVLHDMTKHLTPDNRASIRSAARELPLAAYIALAAVPASEMDNPASRRVWEAGVRALGVVQHGGPSVGQILADTDYPEMRISALLTAHGGTLVGLISEAVRWLVAHDVQRCSLTDLVVLGLADASDDMQATDDAVSRIALAYTRAQRRKAAAA
jgi:hypothetical protein